jgi:PleD family two-component response regulator
VTNPTVSQGVANLPVHGMSAEELVELANRALYQATGQGRDQIIVAPGGE